MVDAGSSFTMCSRNDFIINQQKINNSVKDLSYEAERVFTPSLLSASVLSNKATIQTTFHRKFGNHRILLFSNQIV